MKTCKRCGKGIVGDYTRRHCAYCILGWLSSWARRKRKKLAYEVQEVWEAPNRRFEVLVKHPEKGIWFCRVYSPYAPEGELKHVMAWEVEEKAVRVQPKLEQAAE